MTLLQFITDPETGKPKKNAISRVSEKLGIHHNWLRKYLRGEWEPPLSTMRKMQDIVHSGMKFERKRTRNGLPPELFEKAKHAKDLRAMAEKALAMADELES